MVEQNATARYGMGTIVVMKDWGDLYFQSSNAFIDHRLFERFDASLPESRRGEGADAGANMGAVDVERLFAPIEVTPMADVARVLAQHNNTRMFVSENRLSRPYHRSEEHTSELQSHMRISSAVFCLKKKK